MLYGVHPFQKKEKGNVASVACVYMLVSETSRFTASVILVVITAATDRRVVVISRALLDLLTHVTSAGILILDHHWSSVALD